VRGLASRIPVLVVAVLVVAVHTATTIVLPQQPLLRAVNSFNRFNKSNVEL
jgi:hypothetical protein